MLSGCNKRNKRPCSYPVRISSSATHFRDNQGHQAKLFAFLNNTFTTNIKFSWQEGYGAFTVGYRELDRIYHYILNQEEHHSKLNFKDEYIKLLKEEGINYDPAYLYEFYG